MSHFARKNRIPTPTIGFLMCSAVAAVLVGVDLVRRVPTVALGLLAIVTLPPTLWLRPPVPTQAEKLPTELFVPTASAPPCTMFDPPATSDDVDTVFVA